MWGVMDKKDGEIRKKMKAEGGRDNNKPCRTLPLFCQSQPLRKGKPNRISAPEGTLV